ncbi:hypothetical protein AMECASPLE_037101 [Ameca splendens]|uniref:Uncharacterized protein n=1 Tax=Ameca splendens TaxID=208324 RepID=A0ABV1A377_9TELE
MSCPTITAPPLRGVCMCVCGNGCCDECRCVCLKCTQIGFLAGMYGTPLLVDSRVSTIKLRCRMGSNIEGGGHCMVLPPRSQGPSSQTQRPYCYVGGGGGGHQSTSSPTGPILFSQRPTAAQRQPRPGTTRNPKDTTRQSPQSSQPCPAVEAVWENTGRPREARSEPTAGTPAKDIHKSLNPPPSPRHYSGPPMAPHPSPPSPSHRSSRPTCRAR